MDRREAINDRSLYASNEYPDLDLAPSYLWVGESGEPPHHNLNISSNGSPRQPGEVVCDGLAELEPENNNYTGASDAIASKDNQENPWCQPSGDIDPDFELPEECSTQVFPFSRIVACC